MGEGVLFVGLIVALLAAAALAGWSLLKLRALALSPSAYERVVASMSDGVLVLDADDRILAANPAFMAFVSQLTPESIGAPVETIFASRPDLLARFKGVRDYQGELISTATGRQRYYDLRILPLRNALGQPAGRVIVLREITRSKLDEAQLRRLSQAVEQSANMVVITDTRGLIEYVNPRFCAVTGYSQAEILGRHTRILSSGETPAEVYAELWRSIASGGQWRGEFHNRRKDGEMYWVQSTISPVMDGNGQITNFMAIQEDITERKRIQAAEHEQRLMAEALRDVATALSSTLDLNKVLDRVLNNLDRAITVPHDMTHIMLLENGVARVVRFRRTVENDEPEEDVYNTTFALSETRSLREVVETGRALVIADTRTYPGWVMRATGRTIRSLICAPVSIDGEVIGFLNLDAVRQNAFAEEHARSLQVFADQAAAAIRNAQLYAQVERYAASLEERNQDLDAFSHMVAHDLRAPLNLIVGYLSLIEAEEARLDSMLVEYVQAVRVGADKMNDIIDSLLLLTQLHDTSQVLSRVAMAPVVEAAVGRFRREIETRPIRVEIQPGLPDVLAHPVWVEEVVANLVGNAIKYVGRNNPAPAIRITGRVEDGLARFDVTDNGLGIAPTDQHKLFEMFARFHHDEARGFGLGLAIVQRIVYRLNGRLGVESAPGQGSTFGFALPLPPEEDAA